MKKPINIKFWIIMIILTAAIVWVYSDIIFGEKEGKEIKIIHPPEETEPEEDPELQSV